jgi:tripartite ATP-independent transporter DctM subunit
MGILPYIVTTDFRWTVLPLFVLMGLLVNAAGLARDIYATANKWMGHLPGGLAMATIGGCAGFAATTGNSLVCAMTMGKVSLPEMRRYKYDDSLSTGCLAAGGPLGILIPPSVGFIVYGLLTDTSVGRLFIAGIIPGIMLALMFMAVIYIRVRRNPSLAMPRPNTSWREKLISLRGTIGILALFLLVIGGIYLGVFSPYEAAGIGAFGAALIALIMRRWTRQAFVSAVRETVSLTGVMFFILIGAMVLALFVTVSNMPIVISKLLIAMPLGKWGVFILVMLFYLGIGCIMNIFPAIMITLPMIFPIIFALGFDPVWFGVVMVIMMEMGQITPPIGINVFGIANVARDVPMGSIFKGIVPFLIMMALAIVILSVFPQIALFLPDLMK